MVKFHQDFLKTEAIQLDQIMNDLEYRLETA